MNEDKIEVLDDIPAPTRAIDVVPNPEIVDEMRRFKQYFPYRIVFAAYLDGKFETFADRTKHRMNGILRKGGLVWTL